MLRVSKPTSPMSVGTWILSAFGPAAGAAAVHELRARGAGGATLARRLLGRLARPPGSRPRRIAPAVASYTAVLLSHTAVPGWNEVRDELPFVFTGSAAASGGGFGMLCAPVAENGPARAFAAVGAAQELVASRVMEQRMGLVKEAYHHGTVRKLGLAAEWLTVAGLAGTVLVAGRSRAGAAASGLALLAGSACQRFRVFEAGVESTKDPKYVVVPQRERLAARTAEDGPPAAEPAPRSVPAPSSSSCPASAWNARARTGPCQGRDSSKQPREYDRPRHADPARAPPARPFLAPSASRFP